jgi:hypothetical protein
MVEVEVIGVALLGVPGLCLLAASNLHGGETRGHSEGSIGERLIRGSYLDLYCSRIFWLLFSIAKRRE